MGWSFEDYTPGRAVETAARPITEHDVRVFAELTGDRHPLHLEEAFARTTPFGQPIVHGLLGLGIAFGLVAEAGIFGTNLIALLGVDDWRFLRPVHYGDSVQVRAVVVAARPSSQSDRGIVTLAIEMLYDHQVVVQRGNVVLLVRRGHATGSTAGGATAER